MREKRTTKSLPPPIKLSDDCPTIIVIREPAGWKGKGAGFRSQKSSFCYTDLRV